jgi:hypothetical protein
MVMEGFAERQPKIVKTISAHAKNTDFILRTFKKIYLSRDTIPLKMRH